MSVFCNFLPNYLYISKPSQCKSIHKTVAIKSVTFKIRTCVDWCQRHYICLKRIYLKVNISMNNCVLLRAIIYNPGSQTVKTKVIFMRTSTEKLR